MTPGDWFLFHSALDDEDKLDALRKGGKHLTPPPPRALLAPCEPPRPRPLPLPLPSLLPLLAPLPKLLGWCPSGLAPPEPPLY